MAESSNNGIAQNYRTIFESNVVGIVLGDLSGKITEANSYFLNLIGYTREEVGRGELYWSKITVPEDLEKSVQRAQEVSDIKTSTEPIEKRYVHKNGTIIPVLVGLSYIDDNKIIGVILDLTARKKAEEELEKSKHKLEERVQERTAQLRRSEAFFEAIFENIPNMVFVKDAKDLRFVRFNKAGEELIGVPRTMMMGKNDYDFFPKDQADFFTSKDKDVLKKARVVDIAEEPIETNKGTRVLHTKKIPLLNKDGRAEYLLGISEDITEKKETELQKISLIQEQAARQAAEERALQMSFLSSVSAAISKNFDIDSAIQEFIRKSVEFMCDVCVVQVLNEERNDVEVTYVGGKEPADEEFIAKWVKDHPMRWDAQVGPANVLRTGESTIDFGTPAKSYIKETFSTEAAKTENAFQVASILRNAIKIPGQSPIGLVSYISKTKNYNHMDLVFGEDLSSRLASAIVNSRLYLKAQEASRSKTLFLANMSHEIRTPLGAMLGYAELLKEDNFLDDPQKELITTVLRNGQQLMEIVDEILDISKVESERIQIEKINFDLPDLLKDIIQLLNVRALEKGIELKTHYHDLPHYIKTDPTRLRQILINLLGNAIKFTEKGYVELEVKPGKHLIEFVIKDSGIGIPPNKRTELFQAFSQAETSTTRRFGGTGLGLYLSRKLARLLGGDVILDNSTLGEGTTFIASVGYTEVEEVHPPKKAPPKGPIAGLENIERILIVDDAPDNRNLFVRYLQKMGITSDKIEVAQNGKEAVEKCGSNEYSLVLMDIQMPVMDGFEAVKQLRSQGYEGPVVALTAHAMKGDEEKCLAEGFDGYLQKPLSRDALADLLVKTNNHSH
ncbi:PAS domain S-box protein [Bdellovibrio reynosensis]|uniref:histidine kinase n=1 Tax=Bdellovibrio reynosensis TaxID=2835041 RepID=A0ABY4C6W1_9BACT|nr:PAS domain S-box protein [Bdellovibrio reynosensis]UOF00712.1 PAS domain S-box protein [Bdellovibrio reynosensis]